MSRRDAWTSAWVFAAAAAVRLVYLSEYAHSPLFRQPIVDAATYDTMARALAAGHAGPELFWQAPLYPVFLSVVYAVFGHSFLAARLVQALLGSVTCVLVYLLARKIHGERAARIAAALACFCGPLILYETELVGAGLAAFWSVALTLLFLRAAEKPGAARVLTLGACGALSVLTRPEFLLFFAAAAIWLIGRIRPIRQIGLVAAAFAVIALPFAAWNHSHTGSFSILPASGGINLYIGNNPDE
ncbi:MAG TPA: glycosyltransferase family 39 protein, partial [Kiritimatiellia bacterium]